jgi:ribonuclease P protein subunit POP4
MTPESLPRHELAGLDVTVEASPNPDLVGVAGRVVDETTGTLLVATDDGVKQRSRRLVDDAAGHPDQVRVRRRLDGDVKTGEFVTWQ